MNNRLYRAMLALGLMAAMRPALGVTVYVAPNGLDTRTGLGDWTNAVATISQGMAKATGFYTDIVLVSNGTYNLAATVNVTNGITVRGFAGREQTFVSGGGTIRCFYLSNGGILDGLTVSNGYNGDASSGGGGVYIDKTGFVYNCTFTNNVANYWGGGLYINTNGLVTNCLFVGNMATNLITAANGYGAGGGIYIAAQGVVSNCEFRLNIAMSPNRYGGGGVYAAAGANGRVYDSYFYTNSAGVYGGGANAQYLFNCTFVSNWANIGGGGAYVLTFASNCVFTYNCATNSASGYGGGCYVAAGAALVNCTNISYNIGYRGGGLYVSGTGLVLRVFNNTTMAAAAGVYVGDGGVLSNAVVYCNTNSAGSGGGGVYCINNCQVFDCLISNNVVSGGYGGAGLRYQTYAGNTGLIQGCTFIGNSMSGGSYYDGGGLWFREVLANIAVRRCTFINNSAAGQGGGLWMGGNTGQVENCLIYSNNASSGGGVYLYGTNLLVNCTIVSNTGTTSGGGLYAAGANHRVINTIAYYNNAMLYGTNNVAFTNCGLSMTNGLIGSGLFTNAPAFVNIAGGNFRLGSSSPCINAGTNAAWMETAVDLLNRPRLYYGRVDMGCYEYFLDVKVDGIPIDRILKINGVDKNRIIRISE